MNLLDQIQRAQRDAGEAAVIAHLKSLGLGQASPPAAAPAVQEPEIDGATMAGKGTSIGHLSAMVDELRLLLGCAMDNFKLLHNAAKPDDGPDMDAIIPAFVFAKFVNQDAALRYAIKHSAHDGMITAPPAAPAQPEQEPVRTYLDQIDADSEATQWLHAMLPDGKERVFWSLETFNFSPQEGRVRLLREREKLIACTVIVRDGLNRSQLLKWLIATPPAAAPVPEGWKLAPIEPTDAMCLAGVNAGTEYMNAPAHIAYKAMLAAAPVHPEQEPVYHLRQYGDVTKEQFERYAQTGSIAPPAAQPAAVQEPKKDLLFSTVAMQEREARRIEQIVGTLDRVKQEQLATLATPTAAQPAAPVQEPGTLSIDRLNQWLDASLKERQERKPLTDEDAAFKDYLKDCDEHAINPDVGSAFHFAWQAAPPAAPVQPEQGGEACT
jgi:hypothetical protein